MPKSSKILSLGLLLMLFVSCQTAPKAAGRAPSSIPDSVVPAPETSDSTFEISTGYSSAGRKIILPDDQESLEKKCSDKFANRPEFLKFTSDYRDPNYNKAFDGMDYPITHRAYQISYNFFHESPNWVYHRINRENLKNSCAKRDKGFYADTTLYKSSVPADFILSDKSFKGSGFDRGHMAPSADFIWDPNINKESFFMTNMSPQTPGLNQHSWAKLEDRVRKWACGHGEVEVYTGPVLKGKLKRLESCASIPKQYFKVVVYYNRDEVSDEKAGSEVMQKGKYHGIAFIYSQADQPSTGDPYKSRALSIRELKKITGIDFFQGKYAQEVQDTFETSFDWKDWEGTEANCSACAGVLKQGE